MANQCELLGEALANYEKVAGELEEFRGRVARAEADEQAVLANVELSENHRIYRQSPA